MEMMRQIFQSRLGVEFSPVRPGQGLVMVELEELVAPLHPQLAECLG